MKYGCKTIKIGGNVDIYVDGKLHQKMKLSKGYGNDDGTKVIANVPIGSTVEVVESSLFSKKVRERFVLNENMCDMGVFKEPAHVPSFML